MKMLKLLALTIVLGFGMISCSSETRRQVPQTNQQVSGLDQGQNQNQFGTNGLQKLSEIEGRLAALGFKITRKAVEVKPDKDEEDDGSWDLNLYVLHIWYGKDPRTPKDYQYLYQVNTPDHWDTYERIGNVEIQKMEAISVLLDEYVKAASASGLLANSGRGGVPQDIYNDINSKTEISSKTSAFIKFRKSMNELFDIEDRFSDLVAVSHWRTDDRVMHAGIEYQGRAKTWIQPKSLRPAQVTLAVATVKDLKVYCEKAAESAREFQSECSHEVGLIIIIIEYSQFI